MKSIVFFVTLFILLFHTIAQQDTLPEVEIEASKINKPSAAYKIIALNVANNSSLNDVLKNESALYLKSYGLGNLATVSIRGSNASQTQLIWNGFTINSPTLGQNDLAITSTSLVDNASLHLGASSSVNTSGGLGGVIQLENNTTFNKQLNVELSKEIGSFGIDNNVAKIKLGNHKWQSQTGIVQKKANNNFEYRDFLRENPTEVRQTNSAYYQVEFAQNIYYKPSVNHQLGLKTNFVQTIRELPPVMGVKTKGERQNDEAIKSALEWSYNKGSYFQQIAVGYFYENLNYIDTTVTINSKVSNNSFKGYYKGKYYFNDSTQLRLSLNSDKIFSNSSNFNTQQYQVRDAIYLEYYQGLKNSISYSFSLRKEFITNILAPIVPAFSVKYRKWKNHLIFASGAKNFRAPTLNDLYWNPGGNPNLVPEDGVIGELGYEYIAKKINLSATTYYSLINNWIQWLPTTKGYWEPQNIKEVVSYGVELSIEKSVEVKEVKLKWKGNYNYVISKNRKSTIINDASIGNQLIYVPKNVASLSLVGDYKSVRFNYQQTYNGSVFIDANNQSYMPYYAPASLSLSYSLTKKSIYTNFVLGVTIDNLYNEEYQVVANRPLPGRYYRLILKIELKK